jgi:hypothetical protein
MLPFVPGRVTDTHRTIETHSSLVYQRGLTPKRGRGQPGPYSSIDGSRNAFPLAMLIAAPF